MVHMNYEIIDPDNGVGKSIIGTPENVNIIVCEIRGSFSFAYATIYDRCVTPNYGATRFTAPVLC